MKQIMEALGKRPVVVASLGGEERLVDSARRATKLGADMIEIRIDSLKPKERANVKDLLAAVKEITPCPLIATVRSSLEQGPYRSSMRLDDRERKILFDDAIPLVDCMDIEIASDSILDAALKKARKLGKKMILSHHNFEAMPTTEKTAQIVAAFEKRKGDILKIAGMAKTAEDVIAFFQACKAAKKVNRVFIAMGEIGRISRVAGFLYGSCLTYAYMNKPTAPGQVSVQEMVDLCALFYPSFRAALAKKKV